MINGELNFNGQIELDRFMTPLHFIGSNLRKDEVWMLAMESKLGNLE